MARSAAFYFELLLAHAEKAAVAGNYGISAGLTITGLQSEAIIVGSNSVFSTNDPFGHAEMNALRLARELIADPEGSQLAPTTSHRDDKAGILVFPAEQASDGFRLYASLEPCPMCTVAMINAGVREMVIATPDPLAGAVASNARLPPVWHDLIGQIKVRWTQSTDAAGESTYIPPELAKALADVFETGRPSLDSALRQGVLDPNILTRRL